VINVSFGTSDTYFLGEAVRDAYMQGIPTLSMLQRTAASLRIFPGETPVRTLDKETVRKAVDVVKDGEKKAFACKIDGELSSIGSDESPDEIQFVDVNGDGKADYVWTRKLNDLTRVWYNNYPNSPRWIQGGEIIASGVGTAGSNIRWGKLTSTGRADYLAVEPSTGAAAAFPNGCDIKIKPGEPGSPHDELRMKPDNTTSLLT
jgi:hypothetical protein